MRDETTAVAVPERQAPTSDRILERALERIDARHDERLRQRRERRRAELAELVRRHGP